MSPNWFVGSTTPSSVRSDAPLARLKGPACTRIGGATTFRFWHIASFRCTAEFGRYRGHSGHRANRTNQARFIRTRLGINSVFANPPKSGTTYWRRSQRWIFNLGADHDDPSPRLALERIAPRAAVPRGKGLAYESHIV